MWVSFWGIDINGPLLNVSGVGFFCFGTGNTVFGKLGPVKVQAEEGRE